MSPSAVTVSDCPPALVASTVPVNVALPSPASISTLSPNATGASRVTPLKPRTASRTVRVPAVTVAATAPVNCAPEPNLRASMPLVARSAVAVPEATTRPAQPALPGLLTATVDTVVASKVRAPRNDGSPET